MTHHQPASYKHLVILGSVVLAVAGGYAIRHTMACFLLSFVIAYLLDPVLVALERRGVSRVSGLVILYCLLGLVSFFVVFYLVPLVTIRWDSLLNSLPVYLQKMKELILQQKLRMLSASPAAGDLGRVFDSASGYLDKVLDKVAAGLYQAASRMAFNLFNLVLAPILVFFMLYYKQVIIDGIKVWLPRSQREQILVFGREVNDSIGGYIRGQLIVSLIVAVLSTVALFYLEVDYALLNGIFAGLASILPFIGVILATIPPLFFAYLKFQNTLILVKVIAVFSGIYFLEGYLVKPLVFKESMNLNPLMTIIVVMAFGELMGFWGIMLAIPIAAAMKIFSMHWRRGDFSTGA
jgi:putative permease